MSENSKGKSNGNGDDNKAAAAHTVIEPIAPGMDRLWHLDEIVFKGRTAFQEVIIGRGAQGLGLFCENERQSTELTQRIYHEGQFYPAALVAKKIERVLIIGSSEGVVSQMAVAAGAAHVVHVDIDIECVKLCAEHLPYGYSPVELESALRGEGAVKVVVQDGFTFIAEAHARGERFDLIVMDLPDEQEEEDAQQNRLYEGDFLGRLAQLLTDDGAFITQAGNTCYWRNGTLKRAFKRMNEIFETAVFYELDEHDWTWIVGTRFRVDDIKSHMKARLAALPDKPRFIDDLSIERCTIPPISVRRELLF